MKERVYKYDNLKFVLIFFVVLGHFGEYGKPDPIMRSVVFFIYIFHMPLFLFVSGLFAKRTVYAEKLQASKVLPYFVLYAGIKILYFVEKMLLTHGKAEFTLFKAKSVEWYMFVTGVFLLLTFALRGVQWIYVLLFSILLGCFSGYDASIGDFLCMSRIIVFYPFFFLGVHTDPDKLIKFLKKKWVVVCSVIYLAVLLVLLFTQINAFWTIASLFSGRNPFSKIRHISPSWGFALRGLYYPFVAVTAISVMALVPAGKTWMSSLGQRTLQIYALHKIPLYIMGHFGVLGMMKKAYPSSWQFIFLAIAIPTTFFFALKIFSPPFQLAMKPEKLKEFKFLKKVSEE